MTEQQTDNLQSSPDVVDQAVTGTDESINDPGDFFAQLDRQVNGAFIDSTPDTQETLPQTSPVTEAKSSNSTGDADKLKKRYADSSREAIRLNSRLKELEPYAPLLDKMREDPNLISTVKNYLNGEGKQSVKDRLGVSEDFVFDSDEAISDPESESARVFNTLVDDKVKNVVGNAMAKKQTHDAQNQKIEEFRKKHDMDDEQFKEFMKFATSRSLDFDDIYYLMNRGKRDNQIATETRKEVAEQMANVRQKPQSLASAGAQSTETVSDTDQIFDSMLKEGLANMWNQ